MKIFFPSPEFDHAVAAVCHGSASSEEELGLNELLLSDAKARDEYILRLELHAQLASTPDLYLSGSSERSVFPKVEESGFAPTSSFSRQFPSRLFSTRNSLWAGAIAACLTLAVVGARWKSRLATPLIVAATSKAVAMLDQTVNAQWSSGEKPPVLGAPLDPGWLKLEKGMIQVIFYSGARVVIEGPAEIRLISSSRASCRLGKITAEVPPEAHGFRIDTPEGVVTDLGTSFGVEVKERETELHVFKGSVTLRTSAHSAEQMLLEGSGAVIEGSQAPRLIAANRAAYASLLNVREKSLANDALRFEHWRIASDLVNHDASLRVRFDFEHSGASSWQMKNVARGAMPIDDATVVGCQLGKGRWSEKRALEFQNVSDRVRMNVPGEFTAVTLSAWVRVQGLDRKLNSLFMCDGFGAGTLHWLIRNDGALGVTVVGSRPGDYQIVASPSVVTLDKLGMWLHLAVVVDGHTGQAVHYVNGQPVAKVGLRIAPPYRIGTAELGNWNGNGFPENDPFMIRNFSGAMDDFCLFDRALDGPEIQALYREGRPDLDVVSLTSNAPAH